MDSDLKYIENMVSEMGVHVGNLSKMKGRREKSLSREDRIAYKKECKDRGLDKKMEEALRKLKNLKFDI